MSALVPLTSASRIGQYLRPDLNPGFIGVRLGSKFAWEVRPMDPEDTDWVAVEAEVISGKEAGSTTAVIAANQRAILRLGFIQPPKYQALVCVNPAFNPLGIVQHPTIIEPGRSDEPLDLVITAHREIDLSQFKWLVRCYLVE